MDNLLEMTRDLILAQIAQRNIDADSLGDWLKRTHGTVLMLWLKERVPRAEPMANPIDWRRSFTKKSITCLECNDTFRQLGGKHLVQHGMTPQTYRIKYMMPPDQPLSARELMKRRRDVAMTIRPWEKLPRRRKSKGK